MEQEVRIPAGPATLDGSLSIPAGARALVLFAHGSGSSRRSPRNRFVARTLNEAGLATLLFDLLTREEEAVDLHTAQHRFARVSCRELGEPGCGVWQVRPRLGLIGMLMGWWQVKLSSGCPLPRGRVALARP